ncbi:WbqC family protein [soil metagenome]
MSDAPTVAPTVAIVQSSYIPWRGYFGLIAASETFVFLDSVQFTRRDWRSRNRIKTAQGPQWLTVPVQSKGAYHAAIDEIDVADAGWVEKHLSAIRGAYAQAAFFRDGFPQLEAAYQACRSEVRLSEINIGLTTALCRALNIRTRLVRDTELLPREVLVGFDPTERLVRLCTAAGAGRYLSGPAARSYLDQGAFSRAGVSVAWADYSGMCPHRQLWGAFEPQVSVIDALLNLGPEGARAAIAPVA